MKSKFYKSKGLRKDMNKREEIVLISLAIALIAVTSVGVLFVYNASNSLYVGNHESMEYMDYFECEKIAKEIPEESLVVFKSEKEAKNKGYKLVKGCD